MAHDLTTTIQDFLRYLRVQRQRSVLTVRNYQLYLTRFTSWLNEATRRPAQVFTNLTSKDIDRFRTWLGNARQHGSSRPLAPATQNYHLIALRSFLKFLKEKGIAALPPQAVALATMGRRQLVTLNHDELQQILQAPLVANEPPIVQRRDSAILNLLAQTGLTVSELVALERADIPTAPGTLIIKNQRGGARHLPLSQTAHQALAAYILERHDSSPALFVRHDRARADKTIKPLTPRSVQRLLEHYRRQCGLTQKITPHTLRHAFARSLVAQGVDMKTVQQQLGHQHLATTQVYRPHD